MARLHKLEPLVYTALKNNPQTRKDDFLLVLEVYKPFITEETSLTQALTHHDLLGLPSFASVLRTRRKVQSKHPELKDAVTAEMREIAETDYKEYALGC